MTIYAVTSTPIFVKEISSYNIYNASADVVDFPGNGVLTVNNGYSYGVIDLGGSISQSCVHFRYMHASFTSTQRFMSFYNSTNDRDVLVFEGDTTNLEMIVSYYNGSGVKTELGRFNVFQLQSDPPAIPRYAIYFKAGASGEFKLWFEGQLKLSTTGNYTTQDSTWDKVVITSPNNFNLCYFGTIVVSDTYMHRLAVDQMAPSSAGNSSQWTGAYTDIDDPLQNSAESYSKQDAILSNTPGQKFLANYSLSSGGATSRWGDRIVDCVVIAAAARLDGDAAISDIAFLARFGGTDYTLNSFDIVPDEGIQMFQQIMTTDPAGGGWTAADFSGLQWGVISQ